MEFFIPHTKKSQSEAVYLGITEVIKDQLKLQVTSRKIFSIHYTKDKKETHAEVGQLAHLGRYEVLAIFEASPYIVFTRAKAGGRGITILVNKDEITSVDDFE